MISEVVRGRTDLVIPWISGGGEAMATDEHGTSLIKWCAYYGDVSAIRFLLEHGGDLASLGSNFDLNGAAFHGHWRLCEFLLEQGADPNVPLAETRETPLHSAVSVSNRPAHELTVTVLLAAKANPNAATKRDVPTGAFMRDCKTKGETPLHRAAAFASPTTIESLIAAGANVEAKDANDETPLAWASWHQRPSSILRLLSYGPHSLHPGSNWTGDHGTGWRAMDYHLLGKPRLDCSDFEQGTT